MDIKKLIKTLLALGGLVTVGALVWWVYFYSQVIKELGGDFGDAAQCLYSSGGGCGFVSGLAQMGGATPYNPIVFWVGVILLGVGLILKFSLKQEDQ